MLILNAYHNATIVNKQRTEFMPKFQVKSIFLNRNHTKCQECKQYFLFQYMSNISDIFGIKSGLWHISNVYRCVMQCLHLLAAYIGIEVYRSHLDLLLKDLTKYKYQILAAFC